MINDEKKIFLNKIQNIDLKNTNNKTFWLNNKKELPNLFKLALLLLNIPSSSAYVERFFSICGIVNRKRAGNMADETLITRAFIKSNINLLNQ